MIRRCRTPASRWWLRGPWLRGRDAGQRRGLQHDAGRAGDGAAGAATFDVRAGAYHASDLAETDYAGAADALGVRGIRVEQPAALAGALDAELRGEGVTVIDLVVTRDPAKMLHAADNRAVHVRAGDRAA